MSEDKKKHTVIPDRKDPGFVENVFNQLRLVLRLMGDDRVNIFLKALPLGGLVYMLVPDPIPFVEDPFVLGLGLYMFVEMCPPDVVEEHRKALWGDDPPPDFSDVVDAEFRDKDEPEE